MLPHPPLRVCHFSSSAIGAPYFRNITTGLTAAGFFVLCASLRDEPPPEWLAVCGSARYAELGAVAGWHYPVAVGRLARLLVRERIDILQTHLFDAGVLGVVAGRLARVPLVIVTRHHSDQTALVGSRFHVALDRWMARSADGVVAVSHAVRDYMITQDRITNTPIEVIHLGFDFGALQASVADGQRVRREFGLSQDFTIGCIAHFFETKGHAYLISALRGLASAIPDVRLLLVGGGNRSRVEDLGREHGVAERVVFAGHRSDVPACLKAVDVVVHPSLSEAFSQVVIEAMAVGAPLVATDVGGAREVITDGETGILIPPADVPAIVEAVLRLHRAPDLRDRLAAAGKRSVMERFTVERMVGSQIDCYRRWLKAKA
jgi:glycosyltransferase involved in cell wall biosynthesis